MESGCIVSVFPCFGEQIQNVAGRVQWSTSYAGSAVQLDSVSVFTLLVQV
jgi:hypothetical protein